MKTVFSKLMLLAMMAGALGFAACGGGNDDDVDNGDYGFGGNGSATLTIDGEECCPNEESYINESRKTIQIEAYHPDNRFKVEHVTIRMFGSPLVVSELMEGEMFGAGDLKVKDYMSGIELRMYENEYEITGGYVTVESVTNSRVVLRFENLSFALESSSNVFGEDYYPSNPKIHTINGTASFHNHLYENGDWVPFF